MPTITSLLNRKKLTLSNIKEETQTVSRSDLRTLGPNDDDPTSSTGEVRSETKPSQSTLEIPTPDVTAAIQAAQLQTEILGQTQTTPPPFPPVPKNPPKLEATPPPATEISIQEPPQSPPPQTGTLEPLSVSMEPILVEEPDSTESLVIQLAGEMDAPNEADPEETIRTEPEAESPLLSLSELESAPDTPPEPQPESGENETKPKWEVKIVETRPSLPTPQKLSLWSEGVLSKSQDPLGKSLLHLQQASLKAALFLLIRRPPTGEKWPFFYARAAVGDRHRARGWASTKWNPRLAPDIWKTFLRQGVVYFSEEEHLLKKAFGVRPGEHLAVVRVGPKNACRGMLLVISEENIESEVESILETIHSPSNKKATEAA